MRKLIRRPSRFEGLTVGLDVHQRMIQVSVLDRLGDERTHAVHRLLPRIDELAQEQGHWRARIDELAGTMTQVQRHEQALPGIGPLIAAITREGSAHARWAVIACLRCTRGPGLIVHRWVEAKAKHKPKKHVIVAAARKLTESIWRLFHLGDAFDPAKAFGG